MVGRFPEFDRQYEWLLSRDGSDDPSGWAAGVAGLAQMALTLGRLGFIDVVARAEASLDPEDVGSRCLLRQFPALLSCFAGDAGEAEELVASAESAGDDHAVRTVAMGLACGHANSGRLDATDATVDVVRRALARRGLPFAHDTAPVMTGLAAFSAMHRGDLERARTVADTPGRPDALLILAANAYAAMVGYSTGDIDLLKLMASWQAIAEKGLAAEVRATNEPANLDGPALHVHWTRAVLERRDDDALPLLRTAHERCPVTPALRSYLLVPLAVRLLAAGERNELAGLVAAFEADLDGITDAPLPRTDSHYIRALMARAAGDVDTAWARWSPLLGSSPFRGAAPACRGRAPPDRRARAPARADHDGVATPRRRHRRAVPPRLCHPRAPGSRPGATRSRRRRAPPRRRGQKANASSFADAVELAQRSRGERARPTTGWTSLTPTEQRVAEIVAEGNSNDEVARRLLMSVATVKTHLTHIYAKTGVTGRTELAATLPRHGRGTD